ncbi:MAG: glycosyltransferase, partial [Armatimonadota bacterium]|nr:glycosyltransferase [Armatimonadota bacterium]
EAMSAARPIVATDVGGNSLLLDGGRCGILVPPRDPHALAEAILDLLTNREKAQELARNARQRFLEHFTIDAMGRRYLQVYERAIEEFRRR